MKKSKTLHKIINKLVENSFREGRIMENKVTVAIKVLKSQPTAESIFALSEYLKGVKRIMRQNTMYIETVIPLSTAQIKKIKRIVEKRVKITKVLTQINPEILGGFKLKIGDEIWDESILAKINQVKGAISGRSN